MGKEGTGHIKYYDKDSHLIWEGFFKNKKKEGWHHEYVIDYEGKKLETIDTLYRNGKSIKTRTSQQIGTEKK